MHIMYILNMHFTYNFCTKLKNVVFLGFFVPGFPKLMRFQEHHDRILQKMMPKLKQHLVRHRKKNTSKTCTTFKM